MCSALAHCVGSELRGRSGWYLRVHLRTRQLGFGDRIDSDYYLYSVGSYGQVFSSSSTHALLLALTCAPCSEYADDGIGEL